MKHALAITAETRASSLITLMKNHIAKYRNCCNL